MRCRGNSVSPLPAAGFFMELELLLVYVQELDIPVLKLKLNFKIKLLARETKYSLQINSKRKLSQIITLEIN